jgi:polyhydroxyalkanoate synthesis regulator phasin
MRKRLAAVTVAASMLGGAGIGAALTVPGLAGAQTSTSSSNSNNSSAANGSGSANASTAPKQVPQWVTDTLKKLVDAGTINQSQADAVAKALAEAQPPRPDGPGGPGGPGFGHGRFEQGDDLAIAAKAIGISTADLQTALRNGQSMAAVAKAHNVDAQKVIDALVADQKAELAQAVKDGKLTQAQADQMSGDITQRVTDMVNHTPPPGGPGGRHGHDGPPPGGFDGGPGGPGGPGGSGPGANTTPTTAAS